MRRVTKSMNGKSQGSPAGNTTCFRVVATEPIGVETLERMPQQNRCRIIGRSCEQGDDHWIMLEVPLATGGASPTEVRDDYQAFFDADEAYMNTMRLDTKYFPNVCTISVDDLIGMSRSGSPHARLFLEKLRAYWSHEHNDAVADINERHLGPWNPYKQKTRQRARVARRTTMLAWIETHLDGNDDWADQIRDKYSLA